MGLPLRKPGEHGKLEGGQGFRMAEGLVDAGLDRMNVSLNAGTPETSPNIHVTEFPKDHLEAKRNLRYLSDDQGFADVWVSENYRMFRAAAKKRHRS
jgi:hypothetical protein